MCLCKAGNIITKEAKENLKNHIGYKSFFEEGDPIRNYDAVTRKNKLRNLFEEGYGKIDGSWNKDTARGKLIFAKLSGSYETGFHIFLNDTTKSKICGYFLEIVAKVEYKDMLVHGFQHNNPVVVCKMYRVLKVFVHHPKLKKYILVRDNTDETKGEKMIKNIIMGPKDILSLLTKLFKKTTPLWIGENTTKVKTKSGKKILGFITLTSDTMKIKGENLIKEVDKCILK